MKYELKFPAIHGDIVPLWSVVEVMVLDNNCIARVIDRLIAAGDKAITGNR